MFEIPFLKIVYYVAFPAIFFIGIWLIHKRGKDIKNIKHLRRSDKIKKEEYVKKMKSRIKKYEALFLISLLLFSAGWNVVTSTYCDYAMHSQMSGGTGPKGPAYANIDPVQRSLGPSYDTDKIIKKMEESPDVWFPEDVKEQVDLDELTMMPGHLAVYRLKNYRYILTYTYAAPYPVVKAYGFLIHDEEVETSGNTSTTQETLLLMKEQTIIYPEDPNLANDFIMD